MEGELHKLKNKIEGTRDEHDQRKLADDLQGIEDAVSSMEHKLDELLKNLDGVLEETGKKTDTEMHTQNGSS